MRKSVYLAAIARMRLSSICDTHKILLSKKYLQSGKHYIIRSISRSSGDYLIKENVSVVELDYVYSSNTSEVRGALMFLLPQFMLNNNFYPSKMAIKRNVSYPARNT